MQTNILYTRATSIIFCSSSIDVSSSISSTMKCMANFEMSLKRHPRGKIPQLLLMCDMLGNMNKMGNSLHSTKVDNTKDNCGFNKEKNKEIHHLRQEALQR